MRLTNRRYKETVQNLFLFAMLVILFCLLLKVMHRIGANQFYLVSGMAVIFVLYIFFCAAYFEYDSFGDTLQFRSKRFIKKFTNNRRRKLEIKKSELKKYQVKDYLVYKFLVLHILDPETNETEKVTFDITFLNGHKTDLMKQSLKKVLKPNSHFYN